VDSYTIKMSEYVWSNKGANKTDLNERSDNRPLLLNSEQFIEKVLFTLFYYFKY